MGSVQYKRDASFIDETPPTYIPAARWKTNIRSGSARFLDSLFNSGGSQNLQNDKRQAPSASADTEIDLSITDSDLLELLDNTQGDRDSQTGIEIASLSDPCSTNTRTSQHEDWAEWSDAFSGRYCIVNTKSGAVFTDRSLADLDSSTSGREDISSTNSTSTMRSRPSSIRLGARPHSPRATGHTGSSFAKVLKTWQNPVFQVTERPIPSLLAPYARLNSRYFSSDFNAIKPLPYRHSLTQLGITPKALRDARIIAQVDRKLILASVRLPCSYNSTETKHALVLVDQHAASERINVEALYAQLCTPASNTETAVVSNLGYSSTVTTIPLSEPLIFPLTPHDALLLQHAAACFAQWGVLYNIDPNHLPITPANLPVPTPTEIPSVQLKVLSLPPTIAARCLDEPTLVHAMLRSEAARLDSEAALSSQLYSVSHAERSSSSGRVPAWTARIAKCPAPILSLVHSRACRSAVMFNDELSVIECEDLLRRLGGCVVPWMCAHARVGVVAVCTVEGDAEDAGFGAFAGGMQEKGFMDAWEGWMARRGG